MIWTSWKYRKLEIYRATFGDYTYGAVRLKDKESRWTPYKVFAFTAQQHECLGYCYAVAEAKSLAEKHNADRQTM